MCLFCKGTTSEDMGACASRINLEEEDEDAMPSETELAGNIGMCFSANGMDKLNLKCFCQCVVSVLSREGLNIERTQAFSALRDGLRLLRSNLIDLDDMRSAIGTFVLSVLRSLSIGEDSKCIMPVFKFSIIVLCHESFFGFDRDFVSESMIYFLNPINSWHSVTLSIKSILLNVFKLLDSTSNFDELRSRVGKYVLSALDSPGRCGGVFPFVMSVMKHKMFLGFDDEWVKQCKLAVRNMYKARENQCFFDEEFESMQQEYPIFSELAIGKICGILCRRLSAPPGAVVPNVLLSYNQAWGKATLNIDASFDIHNILFFILNGAPGTNKTAPIDYWAKIIKKVFLYVTNHVHYTLRDRVSDFNM